MVEYVVKKPFNARKGQFAEGYTLCIGIEQEALTKSPYRCYIGNNKKDYYDMDIAKATMLVQKYGEKNVMWRIRGKMVFILPIIDFEHGVKEENNEPNHPKD